MKNTFNHIKKEMATDVTILLKKNTYRCIHSLQDGSRRIKGFNNVESVFFCKKITFLQEIQLSRQTWKAKF